MGLFVAVQTFHLYTNLNSTIFQRMMIFSDEDILSKYWEKAEVLAFDEDSQTD